MILLDVNLIKKNLSSCSYSVVKVRVSTVFTCDEDMTDCLVTL